MLYIIFFFLFASFATRNFVELFVIFFLPETPPIVLVGTILLLALFAVKCGLEVIGRVSAFLLPIVVTLIVLGPLAVFNKMHFGEFLPILENGIKPVLSDALSQAPFLFLTVPWLIIFPFLKNPASAKTTLILTTVSAGIILLQQLLPCLAPTCPLK